jgi:hypothetical protein
VKKKKVTTTSSPFLNVSVSSDRSGCSVKKFLQKTDPSLLDTGINSKFSETLLYKLLEIPNPK